MMTTKENLKMKIFDNLYTSRNNIKDPLLGDFIDQLSNKITSSKLVNVNLFIEDRDAWKYDNLNEYLDYFSFDSVDAIPNEFISDFKERKNMAWHYTFSVPYLFLPFFSQFLNKESKNGNYEESNTIPDFIHAMYESNSYIPFLTDESLYVKFSDESSFKYPKLQTGNSDDLELLNSANKFIDDEIDNFISFHQLNSKHKLSIKH